MRWFQVWLLLFLLGCGSQAVAHSPAVAEIPKPPPTVNVAGFGERSCTYREIGSEFTGTKQIKVICERLDSVTLYYINVETGAVVRVIVPLPAPG